MKYKQRDMEYILKSLYRYTRVDTKQENEMNKEKK